MQTRRLMTAVTVMLLALPTVLVTAPAATAQNPVDNLLAQLGDDLQTRHEWTTFYLHSQEIATPGRIGVGTGQVDPTELEYPEEVPDEIDPVGPYQPDFRFQLDLRKPTAEFHVPLGPFQGPETPSHETDKFIVIGRDANGPQIPDVSGIYDPLDQFLADSDARGNTVLQTSVATFDLPTPLTAKCPAASGFDPLVDPCHTITDLEAVFYATSLAGAMATSSELHVGVHIIDVDGTRIDANPSCWEGGSAVLPCDVHDSYATMVLERHEPELFVDFRPNANTADDTVGTGPVSVYKGSLKLGIPNVSPDPIQLKAGQRIGIDVTMPEGAAILHADKKLYPSSFSTFGDSTRMAAWVEDTQGRQIETFPSATHLTASQRHIIARAIQHNVWGNVDCGAENDRSFQCPLDNVDQNQMKLRIRKLVETQRGFYPGDAIALDPLGHEGVEPNREAACCNTGEITYESLYGTAAVYRYDFPYPADFADGGYQLEFYQPQTHVNPWVVGHRFNVATLDFGMAAAPGGSLVHKALPGEPTEFTVRLYNNGSISDHVSLALRPAPAGWTAKLSETGFQVAPGDYQDVRVTVTPSQSAQVGDQGKIVLTAVSTGNDIRTATIITNIVSEADARPGVALSTAQSVVDVRPGIVNAVPVTLRNTGLRQDSFIVTVAAHGSTDQNSCETWGLGMDSATARIPSQSRHDVIVQVTPPSNTPAAERCVLSVRAQGLDHGGDQQSLLIPMQINVRTGVDLDVFGTAERDMRGAGAAQCAFQVTSCAASNPTAIGFEPDEREDVTSVFRIPVTNSGDREDTFTLQGSWIRGFGTDRAGCAGGDPTGNGVPDGWRYQFPPTGIMPDNDQPGIRELAKLTQPPGATTYQFIELGYIADACPAIANSQAASLVGKYRITARSANDGTVVDTIDLIPTVKGRGETIDPADSFYPSAFHGVTIEMDNKAKAVRSSSIETLAPVPFRLRAINTGNEISDVTISIPIGTDGWTHKLAVSERIPTGVNCAATDASERTWNCRLGIYDEVAFIARLTPPADAEIGDRHDVTVAAQVNGRSSHVDTQKVTARIIGAYDFIPTLHANAISVTQGVPSRVPFTIHNQGTQDDTYFISVQTAPLGWNPSPSLRSIDVPAGGKYHGFIEVLTQQAGQTGEFQAQIQSKGNQAASFLGFTATSFAAKPGFAVRGDSSGDQLVRIGDKSTIKLTVHDTQTTKAQAVNISVDAVTSLPAGWRITPTQILNKPMPASGLLEQEFELTVPSGILPASRLPIHFRVQADGSDTWGDVTVSLASSHGVRLKVLDDAFTGVIGRGTTQTVDIEVSNIGLAEDTIIFCENTNAPKQCKHFFSGPRPMPGFDVTYNPERLVLGPLEKGTVKATIYAPNANYPLQAGETFTTFIFAESLSDRTRGASVELPFTSAVHKLEAKPAKEVVWIEPEASVTQVLHLNNTGSLPLYDLTLEARVPPQGGVGLQNIRFSFEHQDIDLEPGESMETRMFFDMPADLHEIPRFDRQVQAIVSIGSFDADLNTSINAGDVILPEIATTTRIVPHVAFDADDDLIREYAIDRNQDPSDGFEAFLETNPNVGRSSVCVSCAGLGGEPGLAQYLSDEARASKTLRISQAGSTVEVLDYTMDADDDGETELMLDIDADGLPDIYWDPASREGQVTQMWQQMGVARVSGGGQLNLPKDVTADGVLDYFLDLDLDNVVTADGVFDFQKGGLDVVFDVTTGDFTSLIHVDLDDNGVTDYVVDQNGNGKADSGEPVLFAADGRLRTVQIIDVDGDGVPDEVYTISNRGPDYFIRKGGDGTSVPIRLRDVTGDGVADWTFDLNGDGRDESYYDPVTAKSGVVPENQGLMDVVQDFWYIGLLLAAVTVLFVVLLAVTRR